METKDLNSADKGADKKNADKKANDGKAKKIAGMAGGMAAAAAAGVAGTMAAQGMNTPDDEWEEGNEPVAQPASQSAAEEVGVNEEEDTVFDVNEIRIDDTGDDEMTGVSEENEDIIVEVGPAASAGTEMANTPIGSDDVIEIEPEKEPVDGVTVIEIDNVGPDDVVEVMYGGPEGWEGIEPDMYGGPVDFPDDTPEDYLAGDDIADDLLI